MSVTGGRPVYVVWDLYTCEIPQGRRLNQMRQSISREIGSEIAKLYIFCADTRVRESIRRQSNEVINEFPPAEKPTKVTDVEEIISTVENSDLYVLIITGDANFCPTVSMLRQHNIDVGVACLQGHSKMLMWVASYALDWKNLASGTEPNILISRRDLGIARSDGSKMNPIYIYWDLNSCKIEKSETEESMSKLTERFQNILRRCDYWGHLNFFIYAKCDVLKDMHHRAFYANSMTLQNVPSGSKLDAPKMILDNLLATMHNCDSPSCFMIISSGDVRSAENSVMKNTHYLIAVKPSTSPFRSVAHINLVWPDILSDGAQSDS